MNTSLAADMAGCGHTHSGEAPNFSYGSYLEEQEQRHSKQIETLYSQISQKDTAYSGQITKLQEEKAQLEQKLLLGITHCRDQCSHHQTLLREREMEFQEQQSARLSELAATRHDLELIRSQHSDLEESYARKQELVLKYEAKLRDSTSNY